MLNLVLTAGLLVVGITAVNAGWLLVLSVLILLGSVARLVSGSPQVQVCPCSSSAAPRRS